MPVSGLGEEDLAHLSLATNEMAKDLWGGEKSRLLGGEVGEEEEQYSEGEECSTGSEVSQQEWDMPVPGLEEEDLGHLSLATSEMEEGLRRGRAVFRGRGMMQQRVCQEGWEYREEEKNSHGTHTHTYFFLDSPQPCIP
jgi:hypothetical protein